MGIFGDSGIFGKMFDLNRDGKVDCLEQGMEFMFLNELTKRDEKASESVFDDNYDDDIDDGW